MPCELNCGSARIRIGTSAPLAFRNLPPTGTPSGVLVRAFVLHEERRIGIVSWEPKTFPPSRAFPAQLGLHAQVALLPGATPEAPSVFSIGSTPFHHWRLPVLADGVPATLLMLRSTAEAPVHEGTLTLCLWGPDATALEGILPLFEIDAKPPRPHRPWGIAHIAAFSSILCMAALAVVSIATATPVFGRDEAQTEWSLLPLLLSLVLSIGLLLRKSWAVVLLAISNGTLAMSGLAIWVIAQVVSSGSRVYIPALEEGGLVGVLWVIVIPLSILSLVLVLARFSDLTDD